MLLVPRTDRTAPSVSRIAAVHHHRSCVGERVSGPQVGKSSDGHELHGRVDRGRWRSERSRRTGCLVPGWNSPAAGAAVFKTRVSGSTKERPWSGCPLGARHRKTRSHDTKKDQRHEDQKGSTFHCQERPRFSRPFDPGDVDAVRASSGKDDCELLAKAAPRHQSSRPRARRRQERLMIEESSRSGHPSTSKPMNSPTPRARGRRSPARLIRQLPASAKHRTRSTANQRRTPTLARREAARPRQQMR